jgi:hypothetical protein
MKDDILAKTIVESDVEELFTFLAKPTVTYARQLKKAVNDKKGKGTVKWHCENHGRNGELQFAIILEMVQR